MNPNRKPDFKSVYNFSNSKNPALSLGLTKNTSKATSFVCMLHLANENGNGAL